MSKQCCCGIFKELSEPLIINDIQHEPLGPGSFCGPKKHHEIRDLMKLLDSSNDDCKRLKAALREICRTVGGACTDDVSVDFLCQVPAEVKLRIGAQTCKK